MALDKLCCLCASWIAADCLDDFEGEPCHKICKAEGVGKAYKPPSSTARRHEPMAAADVLRTLIKDAERYAARRRKIFQTRLRLQVEGPRPLWDEFAKEYDAACDKEIQEQTVQCDGCQRGLPLRDGKYHDLSGQVGSYPGEVVSCTAARYSPGR